MASALKYYSEFPKMYVAVDCIIFGFLESELKILLLDRDFEPEKGKSSLVGGFVREDEGLEEAATRVLNSLTGLNNVYLEQLGAYGTVNRDPGQRVISVAYYALLKGHELDQKHVQKQGARWSPVNGTGDLIFDHEAMRDHALARLQQRAKSRPIGFELLPEAFTIPQLQNLYEAIFQREFDNRNFRKKLLSMNILEKLDEKDKSSSKKGAFLYRFDEDKYRKFLDDGFLFDL